MNNTNSKLNNFISKLKAKCPFRCTKIKEFFKKNKIISIGLLVVILAFLAGYFLKGLFIAAIVNGKPISRIKVIRELEKYNGATALESKITETLILQEAKKKGIKVTQEEINTQIASIEANLTKSGQKIEDVLKTEHMTMKDLINNLTLNTLIEKMLAGKFVVTDEEVQKYIEDNKKQLPETIDDQTKSVIKDQLLQQKKASEYQKWVDELKAASKIIKIVNY